jgi:hypothetical protein
MKSMFFRLMPRKKPTWQIVAPLILVLAVAAGWSIYWLVASNKAMEVLDQVLAQQKAKGLTVTCGDRQIVGYPFKFMLTCENLVVVRETATRQTSLTAARLVVVVMAYNFNHIIGEVSGPFELTRGRKRDSGATVVEVQKLFYGNAKTVKSSVILENRVLKESIVIVRDLSGTLVDYSNKNGPQNIATDLKEAIVRIRSAGDTSKPNGAYEVANVIKALFLVGGSANIQSDKGARLDDFKVRMTISNAPYQLPGKPLDWLRIWKANDGEARIAELSATSGPVKIKGSGNFNLDDLGRAQGVLNTKMTGLDAFVKDLVSGGRIRQQDAELGLAAINLLGNAGGGGVKIALRAQKGNVYFGPFQIAVLKPLFAQ